MDDWPNHSEAIAVLRDNAMLSAADPNELRSAAYECAAALLEVHDATGISLDNWRGPRELVNYMLESVGLPPFQPNGV